MAEPPVAFAVPRQLRTQSRLAQEELAGATSLSPLSISDLEHMRRDNTMITANTLAVSAKYYHTRARTGTMARIGSGVSGAQA